MAQEGLTKTAMARRMQTSRSALNRLLDAENESVTLATFAESGHGHRAPGSRGTGVGKDAGVSPPRDPLCHARLGPGIQRLFFFMRGVVPARRGAGGCGVSPPHDEVPSTLRQAQGSGQALLFRQKDPKPLAPRRGPSGAFAPVPVSWAAELASLRQSSPSNNIRDRGAATPAGAGPSVMPGSIGHPVSSLLPSL